MSSASHKQLHAELATFHPECDFHFDVSIMSCPSDSIEALTQQKRVDRSVRLRIVMEYRERCFLLIDSLSKQNPKALYRKENRRFNDFFGGFREFSLYNIQNQILFHTTTASIVMYISRMRVKCSGTLYVSRNYLCFEAGSMSWRKRHQIFPFDVVRNVVRENGIFANAIKLYFEFPEGQGNCMMVIEKAANSSGLFELLHILWQRQKRLISVMGNIPPIVDPPPLRKYHNFVCPLILPVGLYTSATAEVVDEVWENQRHYPLLGWSAKLFPSDPPAYSDFSGLSRRVLSNDDPPPQCFEWTSQWEVQPVPPLDFADEEDPAIPASVASAFAESDKSFGFVYGPSWTGPLKSDVSWGNSIRRRLWVRRRKLIPSQHAPEAEAAPAASEEAGASQELLNDEAKDGRSEENATKESDPQENSLCRSQSTASADVIESHGETYISGPMEEEDDDAPHSPPVPSSPT